MEEIFQKIINFVEGLSEGQKAIFYSVVAAVIVAVFSLFFKAGRHLIVLIFVKNIGVASSFLTYMKNIGVASSFLTYIIK